MLPLPKAFQGQNAEEIVTRLLADAYTPVASADPKTRIFRNAQKDHLVRLSSTPLLTEAFCAACQKNTGNRFLPEIFAHATLGPDLHISITENLVTAAEAHENPVTVSGHAHAVAALFEGDDIHGEVHKYMIQDAQILEAVQAISGCALELCKKTPTAIDSSPDGILFRLNEQGCQTIYANPLIPGDKADALQKLQWIEKRFSAKERSATHSPYWR